MTKKVLMNALEIKELVPHRYPFLLIDKVLELEDNERILALKNTTINEEFYQGHFPHLPVMPGVLIMESMAQAACVLAIKSNDGVMEGKTVMIVGANNFKWKKSVLPGDTMLIEMKSIRKRRPLWVLEGTVTVDGEIVAKGELSAMEVAH